MNLLLWSLIFIGSLVPETGKNAQAPSADDFTSVSNILFMVSIGFWFLKTLLLGYFGNTIAMNTGRYADNAALHQANKAAISRQVVPAIIMLIITIVVFIRAAL